MSDQVKLEVKADEAASEAASKAAVEQVEDDLLVEEVSIDGMCGVY